MPDQARLCAAFEPPDRADDCVIMLDRDWRITALDANAREKLDFDDSFVGRDLWELFPLSSATNLREIMQDVLDTGEEARFRFYGRELGSWFDVRVRPAQGGIELAFRDLADGNGAERIDLSRLGLDKLAEEMRRLADRIGDGVLLVDDVPAADEGWDDGRLARLAEAIYRERRHRAKLLPVDFAEPQWDLLLDLFIQATRSNRVSVTSACVAADVPASTALRALDQLVSAGLVSRTEDLHDKRRVWVALSKRGMDAMRGFLRHAAAAAVDVSRKPI